MRNVNLLHTQEGMQVIHSEINIVLNNHTQGTADGDKKGNISVQNLL